MKNIILSILVLVVGCEKTVASETSSRRPSIFGTVVDMAERPGSTNHGYIECSAIVLPDGVTTRADLILSECLERINAQYDLHYTKEDMFSAFSVETAIGVLRAIPDFFKGCYSEADLKAIGRNLIKKLNFPVKWGKLFRRGGEINEGDPYEAKYIRVTRDNPDRVTVIITFEAYYANELGLTRNNFYGSTTFDWSSRLMTYFLRTVLPEKLEADIFLSMKKKLRADTLNILSSDIAPKVSQDNLFKGAERLADLSLIERLSIDVWDLDISRQFLSYFWRNDFLRILAGDLSDYTEYDYSYNYGSVVLINTELHELFHNYLSSKTGLRVLDLGGNFGNNTLRHLFKHQVTLCDLNPNALYLAYEFVRKHMLTFADNLTLSSKKAQDLKIETGTMDVIFLGYLVKYFKGEELDSLFKLMNEWMKPGAQIFLVELCQSNKFYDKFKKDDSLPKDPNWPNEYGRKKINPELAESNYFINRVSTADLVSALDRAGFNVIYSCDQYAKCCIASMGIRAKKNSF